MENINETFWPKVLQVVPTDDFEIYTYFNDGSVRLFDTKPLLQDGTVFEPLKNISFFKETLTILNETVAFDIYRNRDLKTCIDLDPFVIFQQPFIDDSILH